MVKEVKAMVEAICFFLSTILGIVIEYFLKEWLDKVTHSSEKGNVAAFPFLLP